MIRPTLFIGLGTTGTKILKTLRQLMSEEYRYAGLPIFRYISIETQETETGDNSRQFEDYEQIRMVNATIEDTAPIRRRLDSTVPMYNPHLTDWLNPSFLNEIQSVRDGASNIRMAGRLCLWENWEEIQRTLSIAHSDIIMAGNTQQTLEILSQHYEAKNLNIPNQLVDQDGINAYVVGTLCGGSCSGMLIDIAYFLRYLFGGNNNNIYGVFTMFDRLLASNNRVDAAIFAANCYASLTELNYYNNLQTTYDITFPSYQRVNTGQIPYDYTMLVSPTGKLPNIRFVSDFGQADEDGMNLMVALNLFADTVADTDGQKKRIQLDWVQHEDYGGLKPEPSGDTPTMVKCLASFGLTAVWYPKYRIASAAASLVSHRLCQNWSKGHINRATIKAEAIQEWDKIIGNAHILASPEVESQPALKDHIESLLNTVSQAFNRQASANTLQYQMNTFPHGTGGTFRDSLDVGGRYFVWMASKVDDCKDAFNAAIDRSLNNQLTKIDFRCKYGLGDVSVFFEELDQIIEQALQQCPERLPVLDLNELDFEPMRRTENNFWIRIIGLQKRAVEAQQKKLVEDYRQLVTDTHRKVQNYFLRQVLEEARSKLGFRTHSDGPTIRQQLDQIQENLIACDQTLNRNYEFEIEHPQFTCIKIVTNNPQNSIQTDAESLSTHISNDETHAALLVEDGNPTTMDVFLKKGHKEITLQMTETYRRSALSKINEEDEDNVLTKVRELLNIPGNGIEELARRSNPYQEFTPEYQPFPLEIGTKIIFGHDSTYDRLQDLMARLGFERSGNSLIDHFLFFYEEEAGFALDDLAVYELLKYHFEQNLGIYGHWTHKDPNVYNLKSHFKGVKLEQWCRALVPLVPEIRKIDPEAFKDVFEYQGEDPIFAYQDGLGLDSLLRLSDAEEGIKALCRHENEDAYKNFFDSVKAEFSKLEKEKVIQLVSELTEQTKNINERYNLSTLYNQFLQQVYPDRVR